MHPRDRYPRTTCDCAICQTACRTMPGYLAPGDAERIAEHQGITEPNAVRQFVKEHFCASTGGIMAAIANGQLHTVQIPTVVPQQRANGECVFLQAGRCTIHAVSPFGCSHFDTHQTREQGERISREGMIACGSSEGYLLMRDMLIGAGRLARPVADRKEAYLRAEEAERARRPVSAPAPGPR